MKMKDRNAALRKSLGTMANAETVKTINSIPVEDTVNRNGSPAYAVEDELRLIAMLNTLKLEPQFYRSENETMIELRDLIERIALKDPYFVAQCIVYSRCKGEGMRSINHLAAALLAPFISGQEFAKRFYGPWNKKEDKGGCIYRPDDMTEIKDVYAALNKGALTNAMKKGFASYIGKMDAYQMTKYKKTVIDIANLVHPKSNVEIEIDGKKVNVLNAIMNGINIAADTWETAQSEAGQEVAKAVREGKLTKEKAEQVLKEAKEDNWKSLLNDGKLGILAALRNIRNILSVSSDEEVVKKLCKLLSNGELIRKGLIMPYQIDMAYEIVRMLPGSSEQRDVMRALQLGYITAVPNLAAAMPGKTVVLLDCSGSMHTRCAVPGKAGKYYGSTVCEKAGLIAATIAKATNADVVRFGTRAIMSSYNPNEDVFTLGSQLSQCNMGGTSIPCAFDLLQKRYDRIILISDNECNERGWGGTWTSGAYKNYIRRTGFNGHVYAIDMACYDSVPLKGDNVHYYAGYGFAMFEDIATKEFNPNQHIDKVRKIVI